MERPECVEPLPLEYCEALETESKKYILFLAKFKNQFKRFILVICWFNPLIIIKFLQNVLIPNCIEGT